ncbi:hypothetical protein [Allokutzneria multivorans]
MSTLGLTTVALASFALAGAGTAQAAEFRQWGPFFSQQHCIGEGNFREGQLQVNPDWVCLFPAPYIGWYVAGPFFVSDVEDP